MRRLFRTYQPAVAAQEISVQTENFSLHERLMMTVGSGKVGTSQTHEGGERFKNEFENFDRHRIRGPLLKKLYDALCTIQPTSTQRERNFSLAAGIATKIRNRISSEKLNAACFLKSYFVKQKKTQ